MRKADKFTYGGKTYQITTEVYKYVKIYLSEQNDIVWVNCDPPYITFGFVVRDETKRVKHNINSLLSDANIAKFVINNLNL